MERFLSNSLTFFEPPEGLEHARLIVVISTVTLSKEVTGTIYLTKAGVTRNQLGLCKLILPVQYTCFSISTSQNMLILVSRIGTYNAPLQLLGGRILKKILLMEKKQKYCFIMLNVFFSL